MFQFPALASRLLRIPRSPGVGCPIRVPAAQWLFAPPRGFSQLITPFFASESQGILRTPLLASLLLSTRNLYFLNFIFPACQRTFTRSCANIRAAPVRGYDWARTNTYMRRRIPANITPIFIPRTFFCTALGLVPLCYPPMWRIRESNP